MKADDLQALSKTSAGPEMGRVKENTQKKFLSFFVCMTKKQQKRRHIITSFIGGSGGSSDKWSS